MFNSGSNDIVFLLGAGASAEAGIPTSGQMIESIESDVRQPQSRDFEQLYYHIKSAIYFSAGLRGKFNNDVSYNIETLVNTLYELERNEEHPLYPFIASWNARFAALSDAKFEKVKNFRLDILKKLKKWVCPDDESKSGYFNGLADIQRSLNYSLRVFSLNYDLCVELLNDKTFKVETGFGGMGPNYAWNWERFEDGSPSEEEASPTLPQIYLYKLHGSINWKRNSSTRDLFCVNQVETIEVDKMEIIFGRDFKLEAADPYLFYAYEFRRFCLNCRVIVTIGYGFGDAHINKMIFQSLITDRKRRIVVVDRCEDLKASEDRRDFIVTKFDGAINKDQVIVEIGTAKSFLQDTAAKERIIRNIIPHADSPF